MWSSYANPSIYRCVFVNKFHRQVNFCLKCGCMCNIFIAFIIFRQVTFWSLHAHRLISMHCSWPFSLYSGSFCSCLSCEIFMCSYHNIQMKPAFLKVHCGCLSWVRGSLHWLKFYYYTNSFYSCQKFMIYSPNTNFEYLWQDRGSLHWLKFYCYTNFFIVAKIYDLFAYLISR